MRTHRRQPKPRARFNARAWLTDWRSRVRQPGPWRARLAQLQEAVERVDKVPDPAACAELESMLEAYASDQLRGAKIGRHYARLKAHLAICPACREKLEFLSDGSPADQAASILTSSHTPLHLSFLHEPDQLWTASPLPQLQRPARGLSLYISPALLNQRLIAPPALNSRAGGASSKTLVLAGTPNIAAEEWNVSVYIEPMPHNAELLKLCAALVSDNEQLLKVQLRWGEQVYTQDADQEGNVCFENLPMTLLAESAAPVILDVEVVASRPPTE